MPKENELHCPFCEGKEKVFREIILMNKLDNREEKFFECRKCSIVVRSPKHFCVTSYKPTLVA